MAFPDWLPLAAWNEWLKMREKRRWVITDRVIRMHLKTLEEFREQGWDIEFMIDEATNKNWREFYPTARTPRDLAKISTSKVTRSGRDMEFYAQFYKEHPELKPADWNN